MVTSDWEDLQAYASCMADVTGDVRLCKTIREIQMVPDPGMHAKVVNVVAICACRRLRAITRSGGGRVSLPYGQVVEAFGNSKVVSGEEEEEDDGVHTHVLRSAYFQGIVHFIAQNVD